MACTRLPTCASESAQSRARWTLARVLVEASEQPARQRPLAQRAHLGIVSAVEVGLRAVSLRVVEPEACLGVVAALVMRSEHVERRPLTVMSLDEVGGVAQLPCEMQQLVGALAAGAMVHGDEPVPPARGDMEPGLRNLLAQFQRASVEEGDLGNRRPSPSSRPARARGAVPAPGRGARSDRGRGSPAPRLCAGARPPRCPPSARWRVRLRRANRRRPAGCRPPRSSDGQAAPACRAPAGETAPPAFLRSGCGARGACSAAASGTRPPEPARA